MNYLNSILLEGNLVRDPELKYAQKGAAVCSFALASNRFFKQDAETRREVSFFNVSCWTRLAEVCGESLLKGRGVRVVGRLKQDRWTDADGQEGGEKADEPAAQSGPRNGGTPPAPANFSKAKTDYMVLKVKRGPGIGDWS